MFNRVNRRVNAINPAALVLLFNSVCDAENWTVDLWVLTFTFEHDLDVTASWLSICY